MAVGAIFGYIIGCYANSLGIGIATAFAAGALCGLLFAVLTVSLQANQNITGLTLTTFGLGVYFFVGNSIKAVGWPVMGDYAAIKDGFADLAIPGLSQIPLVGHGLFNHNILVYLGVVIAVAIWWYLNHTTPGLRLLCQLPGCGHSGGIFHRGPLRPALCRHDRFPPGQPEYHRSDTDHLWPGCLLLCGQRSQGFGMAHYG
jgi:simple sugar transport system permease protein